MANQNRYALFLGCTIPVRAQNYELATRKVAAALGIEFEHIPYFTCCGYPAASLDEATAEVMAARNLALAQQKGCDIATICTACTGVLTETAKQLDADESRRRHVNEKLQAIGLDYKPGVKVRHFARILFEEVGIDKIKSAVKKPLNGVRVAAHYGCHFVKPSEIYDHFDSSEFPHTLDDLITATGATAVDYPNKMRCCGGALLAVDENLALRISKEKLDQLKALEVDAISLVCPFCSVMYESNQKKIETTFQAQYNLPVIYYPQLLGLAMGMDPKDLGFQLNRVRPAALLAKAGA